MCALVAVSEVWVSVVAALAAVVSWREGELEFTAVSLSVTSTQNLHLPEYV